MLDVCYLFTSSISKMIGIYKQMEKAKGKAQTKYNKTHTKLITIRLNLVNDLDIIKKLNDVSNKQGYIKELIKKDIAKN